MSQQELTEEQFVQQVYDFAAGQMANGVPPHQIQANLVEQGLDPESAATVVSNLVSFRSEALRKEGKKNMLYGGLWCVGGIAVTALTFSFAAPGGSYLVAWGAIIFGAIQFFRGMGQASQA